MLMLLVWGPHFEDQSPNGKLAPHVTVFPTFFSHDGCCFIQFPSEIIMCNGFGVCFPGFASVLFPPSSSALESHQVMPPAAPFVVVSTNLQITLPSSSKMLLSGQLSFSSIISASILGVSPSTYMTHDPITVSITSSSFITLFPIQLRFQIQELFQLFPIFPLHNASHGKTQLCLFWAWAQENLYSWKNKTKKHRVVLLVSTLNI